MNTINCPNCGAEAPVGSAFCDNCGNSLASVAARPGPGSGAGFGGPAGGFGGQQRCPNCGESIMAGEAFCGNCGTPLSTAAPTAFVPPPPVSSAPSWTPPPPPPPVPSWPSSPPAPPAPSWPSSPSAPADSWPSSPVPQSWGAPPVPQPAGSVCPNCGSPIQPSDVFCDNCGHALTPGSGFPSEPQIPVTFESDPHLPMNPPEPPAPVIPVLSPRLVVQASGATLNLAPGKNEYLIGREDPVSGSFPDVDLVPYGGEEGGVSRRHAQILRRGGQFSIEDLNSVNYTFVNRQKVAPGTPHPLQDGDEVRLGRVVLQFKTN